MIVINVMTPKLRSILTSRRWYEQNKERAFENTRKWRKKHPEKAKEIARKGKKKQCKENHAAIYKYQRSYSLRRKYDITKEQWDAKFEAQGRCCAGCKTIDPGRRGWQTDHCHKTNKFRSILCTCCNLAIGLLRDNVETLRALAVLLENEELRKGQ